MLQRVSLRIAAAMLPVVIGVVSVFGVASAQREGRIIEQELQREVDTIALSSASFLALAWGHEQVSSRVEQLNQDLDAPVMALLSLDQPLSSARRARSLTRSGNVVSAAQVLSPEGTQLAQVLVWESLERKTAYVRRTLLLDSIAILVAGLIASLFAMAVGQELVQKRVMVLAAALEGVGVGRYVTGELDTHQDELGMLGRAVGALSDQLKQARSEASEQARQKRRAQLSLRRADRLAAVGRTTAVFAHEIGTPLGVISGRAERISLRDGITPATQRDAQSIRSQTDRIAAFVRRLLDHSRPDSSFELRPLDALEIIRTACGFAQEAAQDKSVHVQLELPPHPVIIEADPQSLEQVVVNLVNNALDASPAEGVVQVRCAVTTTGPPQDGDQLRLEVQDQGKGITPELREHIFSPFFSTKAAGQGTGLGLSIVQQIVQDHGGTITIADTGPGCRMVVNLPLAGVADV